jgi:uncharacterized Zn finger protein
MTDDPQSKITLTCDSCGKRDSEVRRMFEAIRWGGRRHVLCNECVFVSVTIMLLEDREWFEKEVEEIKRHLDSRTS